MTDENERELLAELARLQQEHRDLDAAIVNSMRTAGRTVAFSAATVTLPASATAMK